MKPTLPFFLGASVLLNTILITNFLHEQNQKKGYETYKVEGDESPGIAAGDSTHPDLAMVWYDEGFHIGYIPTQAVQLPGIKTIEWPETFTQVLNQQGEIHSSMGFRELGDTLKVQFEEQ